MHTVPSKHNSEHCWAPISWLTGNEGNKSAKKPHYALQLTNDHFKEHASIYVINNCKHKFLFTTVVVCTITQFLILFSLNNKKNEKKR